MFSNCALADSNSVMYLLVIFFFKQKTAYEMRISDWSSDVCSSVLASHPDRPGEEAAPQTRPSRPVLAPAPRHPLAADLLRAADDLPGRSEERRVGKECVSTWRSRWWTYH